MLILFHESTIPALRWVSDELPLSYLSRHTKGFCHRPDLLYGADTATLSALQSGTTPDSRTKSSRSSSTISRDCSSTMMFRSSNLERRHWKQHWFVSFHLQCNCFYFLLLHSNCELIFVQQLCVLVCQRSKASGAMTKMTRAGPFRRFTGFFWSPKRRIYFLHGFTQAN